jgi:site-specific DNA recombinase
MAIKTTQLESALRCAIYARISPKPEGVVGDNYSIAAQLHEMTELAKRDFGCPKPVQYIDDKVSGATLDRPALERLRDALAMRMYDVVIAYSPDRLSREIVDSMVLTQEIAKCGAKLVFVSGSYEDSPEGEFAFGVQSLVSRYERKKLAERSRRCRKQKAREGFVHSGSAPYGYRYLGHKFQSRGTLEVIEEQAKVVRMIFEWTAQGLTNYRVAMELNELGIPTAKGSRWYRESVAQVLRKTVYYGEVKGPAGIIVPVPTIISRVLWDRAHDQLRRNLVAYVGRPSRQYLLTGYLWCAKCGARCTTFPQYGGQAAYRCNGVDPYTHRRICPAGGIRQTKLESAVWDAVWDTITNPDLLWRMIAEYQNRAAAKPKAAKDPVLVRIDRARRRLERAEEIFRDPDQPIAYTQAKADVEAARRDLLEAETARPAADVIQIPARADIAAVAREFARARHELKEFAHRRGVIERVVEKIRYAEREVEIHCRVLVTPKKNCNRHVGAEAQSQGDYRKDNKAGTLAKCPQRKADILQQTFH